MTPGQKKRIEAARRAAKSAKDRADYDARKLEKARQAGIKARTAEEVKAALEAREAERAQLRRPRYTRDQLGRALLRLGSRVGGVGTYPPGPWKFGRHYNAKVNRVAP